jgi:hypothetical protein
MRILWTVLLYFHQILCLKGMDDCERGFYRTHIASTRCIPCPAGVYSSISYTGDVNQCNTICPPGSYCPEGSASPIPCPSGYYSRNSGSKGISCDGFCHPGYFCTSGSTRPDQNICGNASYICPLGSPSRILVKSGFYSGPLEAQPYGRYEEIPCEPGFFCQRGVRLPCPSGVFGNVSALTNLNCTSQCPLGSFCPIGSIKPTPCPAGTFGATPGLSKDSCSGLCEPGYWCPAGSSSAQERACPAGRYGVDTGLSTRECSHQCEVVADLTSDIYCQSLYCSAGYFCPPASFSATQARCGGAGVYCPSASALPTASLPPLSLAWTYLSEHLKLYVNRVTTVQRVSGLPVLQVLTADLPAYHRRPVLVLVKQGITVNRDLPLLPSSAAAVRLTTARLAHHRPPSFLSAPTRTM